MSHPMHQYLLQLCRDNPDGVPCALVFKTTGLVMGALRWHEDKQLFEHVAPAQLGQNSAPMLGSAFFTHESVDRVMVFSEISKIVPVSGIQIGS